MNKQRILTFAKELKRHYMLNEDLHYPNTLHQLLKRHTEIDYHNTITRFSISKYFDIPISKAKRMGYLPTIENLIEFCRMMVNEEE